jgi:cobalt/nickel transport system permease protein
MHIPDGFLDTKTIAATAVLSAGSVGYAVRRVSRQMETRRIPLMGLAAAFVFVAQMLNFPVAAGTSGHLLGGVLVAVLLGLDSAMVVMAIVLLVQSVLFADGGLLALGANIVNMAVIAPATGYAAYRGFAKLFPSLTGRLAAASVAAWMSTVITALCCAGELAWSGTAPWPLLFPAMSGVHLLIGLGEAVITVLILLSLAKARPESFDAPGTERDAGARPLRAMLVYGTAVTVVLGVFVAPFASAWPDGLEHAAASLGFDVRALAPSRLSPMSEYQIPGLGSFPAATAVAALIGIVLVFALSFAILKLVAMKTSAPRG